LTLKRIPVRNFNALRKVCAELALIIKYLSIRGHSSDIPFGILCTLFRPLVRKLAPQISRRRQVPMDEVVGELHATLFELVVRFDWDRCVDGNLFALYVKRCLSYVTDFRINSTHKVTAATPSQSPTEDLAYISPTHIPVPINSILSIVEESNGSRSSDLLFCLFSLHMPQTDAGKIFKVPQVTISKWWRDLAVDVRKLIKGSVRLRQDLEEIVNVYALERTPVSYQHAIDTVKEVRDVFDDEFPILGSNIVDEVEQSRYRRKSVRKSLIRFPVLRIIDDGGSGCE